jgi:hypothetical protein
MTGSYASSFTRRQYAAAGIGLEARLAMMTSPLWPFGLTNTEEPMAGNS